MYYVTNHPFSGSPMGPYSSSDEAFAEICALGLQECGCAIIEPSHKAWDQYGTVDIDGQHLFISSEKRIAELRKRPGQKLCWVETETYTSLDDNHKLEIFLVHPDPEQIGKPWTPFTYKNGVVIDGKPVCKGTVKIFWESYSPDEQLDIWFEYEDNENPLQIIHDYNDGWHCNHREIRIISCQE